MMSSHGLNLIFFNKKNIDWSSRTLANPTLTPLRPIIYQYFIFVLPPPHSHTHTHTHTHTPTHTLPPPLKVDVICLSPLTKKCIVVEKSWFKEITFFNVLLIISCACKDICCRQVLNVTFLKLKNFADHTLFLVSRFIAGI